MFVAIGCTGSTKEIQTDTSEVTSEKNQFDGEFISFEYSEPWIVSEDTTFQMVTAENQKTKCYVLIKLEKDSFQDAESTVKNFAQTYGGTPVELVTYGDINYYQTSFEHGKLAQTMLVNTENENKLTITLQGNGHENDESIKDILRSITLKY
jgi:hypothetical protein